LREARPTVLVGTTSIETSERLAKLLQGAKIPHEVLNAKHMEREAHIVARPAARCDHHRHNMAGAADIVLGGSPQRKSMPSRIPTSGPQADSRRWRKRHEEVVLRRPPHRRYRAP